MRPVVDKTREQNADIEPKFWLVKQEPEDFGWELLVRDRVTQWTGVRNFQARNHLRQMRVGELVLFYHSGEEKRIVGVAKVNRAAYPDPTASEGSWLCVDIGAVTALSTPVDLATIKQDKLLAGTALVRQSRLSVMPLTSAEFHRILRLGRTTL